MHATSHPAFSYAVAGPPGPLPPGFVPTGMEDGERLASGFVSQPHPGLESFQVSGCGRPEYVPMMPVGQRHGEDKDGVHLYPPPANLPPSSYMGYQATGSEGPLYPGLHGPQGPNSSNFKAAGTEAGFPSSLTAAPVWSTPVEGVPIIKLTQEAAAQQRKCTDLNAQLMFIFYLCLGVYVAGLSLSHGSVQPLIHGVNFNGRVCGSAVDGLAQFPYLFYPLDPTPHMASGGGGKGSQLLPGARRCLRACPTEADVRSRKVIPITRTHMDRSIKGTSATLVEYVVNTPVYASVSVGGRLCFPEDPTLALQLSQHLLSQPLITFRAIFGSFVTARPVVALSTMVALALAVLVALGLKTCPRLVLLVSAFATVALGVILGGCMLSLTLASNKGRSPQNELVAPWVASAQRFPIETTGCLFAGIVCWAIAGFVATVLLAHPSKDVFLMVGRIFEATADVVWSRGAILFSPFLISLVNALLGWVWIWTFLRLAGVSSHTQVPIPLSSGRNGGVTVLSAERQDRLPSWALFALVLWVVAGFWIKEFLACLTKFAAAYAGTMWYYVPPFTRQPFGHNESDESLDTLPAPQRTGRFAAGVVSVFVGLAHHVGSFAVAAWLFGITRVLRIIFAWVSPLYGAERWSNRWTGGRASPTPGARGPHLGAIADSATLLAVSNGAFVEMAVASTSLGASLKTAVARGNRPGSVVAGLLGVAEVGTSLSLAAIVLSSGTMTFSILTKNPEYTNPMSNVFIPSPLFVALVTMVLTASLARPLLDSWAVLADTFLYCYALEGSESDGAGPPSPSSTADDPRGTHKPCAPSAIQELVLEAMGH